MCGFKISYELKNDFYLVEQTNFWNFFKNFIFWKVCWVLMSKEINIIKVKNERWVVYSNNIEATKINSDWYLWIHHTIDKTPNGKETNILGKKII